MPGTLTHNFQLLAEIVQTFAILMGLAMFIGGILQFKRYGESRTMMSSQMSVAGPLLLLLGGSVLLILPTFISTMLLAFWGNNNPTSYTNNSSTGIGAFLPAIILLVRVIGACSFIRGIHLMSRAGGHQAQHGTLGKALIHILAGILCVHIVGTTDLIASLMGFSNY